MKRWTEKWSQFWFTPSEPSTLGVCRFLSFALLFATFRTTGFSAWGEVGAAFWMPVFPFAMWQVPPASSSTLLVIATIWRCSLVTGALGLATRASTIVSAFAGVYLLGMISCFGKINHSYPLVVFILITMAVSRCGDAFSIDAWLAKRRGRELPADAGQHGEYTWPIRLIWFVMITIFFGAGTSKLRASGLAWAQPENLSFTIQSFYFGSSNPWNSIGLYIAQSKACCLAIGISTLVLEVGCPLALISRRLRPVFVIGLFTMQGGIYVIMAASFMTFLAGYVFWVPWLRLYESIQQRTRVRANRRFAAVRLDSSL